MSIISISESIMTSILEHSDFSESIMSILEHNDFSESIMSIMEHNLY